MNDPIIDYISKTADQLGDDPNKLAVRSFSFDYQGTPVETLVAAGNQAPAFIGVINFMLAAIAVNEDEAFSHINKLRDMVAEEAA